MRRMVQGHQRRLLAAQPRRPGPVLVKDRSPPEADGAEVTIYATGQGPNSLTVAQVNSLTVAQVKCATPRALKQARRGRDSPGAGGCDRAAVWRGIPSNSTAPAIARFLETARLAIA